MKILFNLLKSGKLEGAILADVMLKDEHFSQPARWKIHSLKAIEIFHYLHKKHQLLVEPLTEVLNELSDSGEIEKIRIAAGAVLADKNLMLGPPFNQIF